MCAFSASVRDQLDLTSLSDEVVDGELEEGEPTGIPRVYHEPDTESDEDVSLVRPSAARLPGTGMLGIDVRMVFLLES